MKKQLALLFILILTISSCHFIGDSNSTTDNTSFFAGLWDGSVLIWKIIINIVSNDGIMVFQPDFAYRFGFAVGSLALSWNVGLFVAGPISMIFYLTTF